MLSEVLMSEGNTRYEAGRRKRDRLSSDETIEPLYSARPQAPLYKSEKRNELYESNEWASLQAGSSDSYRSDKMADAAVNMQPAYTPNEPEVWEYPEPSQATLAHQPQITWESHVPVQHYRRPAGQANEEVSVEEMAAVAFAPPPKFTMPRQNTMAAQETADTADTAAEPQHNIYQTKQATWADAARRDIRDARGAMYQVQAGQDKIAKRRRRKRMRRRITILVCAFVLMAGGAYWGREWIGRQAALLVGREEATPLHGTEEPSATPVKGYDAAPETSVQMKTRKGIEAVCGNLEIENVAVTQTNVVVRSAVGDDLYDYYLFATADGRLLGYYEGIEPSDFLVQPNDCFYLRQPPYLLNSQGKAFIRPAVYEQLAGRGAVLSPMENGWAILGNAERTQFNYINADGALLSRLWFCRAIPFRSSRTLAYVDTGNLAKTEERYALYVLSVDGEMSRWQYAADTKGLVGTASGLALMGNGDLIQLSDLSVLCKASEMAAYLDCDALVVKERDIGKYGLFIGGEQQYGFYYDQIAPVSCDIQWQEKTENGFTQYVVAGTKYPQPLSHYFLLQKDGKEEMVALSTRSNYPLVME